MLSHDFCLCDAKRRCRGRAAAKRAIELRHEAGGDLVVDRPETRKNAGGAGDEKGTHETDAFIAVQGLRERASTSSAVSAPSWR